MIHPAAGRRVVAGKVGYHQSAGPKGPDRGYPVSVLTSAWEFWIDVGGTFTDCLARTPDGRILTHKLLSTGCYQGRLAEDCYDPARRGDPPGFFVGWTLNGVPVTGFDDGRFELARPVTAGEPYLLESPQEAPLVGIRWLGGLGLEQPIGPVSVRLGTTRGTNALLERQGAATAFVTTRGFGDCLVIGTQNRPRLFDLDVRKPEVLYQQVVELDERLDATGSVLRPLDPVQLRAALTSLRESDIVSLAVCLLHAHRNPSHEQQVAEAADELGFEHVVTSSDLAPFEGLITRAATTVLEAYLSPIIRRYVADLRAAAPDARLRMMTSAGALVDADRFVAKDSVLSGPAGGVVGCVAAARAGEPPPNRRDPGGGVIRQPRGGGPRLRRRH